MSKVKPETISSILKLIKEQKAMVNKSFDDLYDKVKTMEALIASDDQDEIKELVVKEYITPNKHMISENYTQEEIQD